MAIWWWLFLGLAAAAILVPVLDDTLTGNKGARSDYLHNWWTFSKQFGLAAMVGVIGGMIWFPSAGFAIAITALALTGDWFEYRHQMPPEEDDF